MASTASAKTMAQLQNSPVSETEMKENDANNKAPSKAVEESESPGTEMKDNESSKIQENPAKSHAQASTTPSEVGPQKAAAPAQAIGPSVVTQSAKELPSTNPTAKGTKSGGFTKLLGFLSGQKPDNAPQPTRLKFQLPNSKGETFELFPWLKPTKLLGEGAYAAVCEVIDERTNKKYAVKKHRDVFSNVAVARRILREIKLMMHFDHVHVTGLCGVVPPEPHDRETYKDCYVIMPRMDTTLSKVIRSKQKLSGKHIQYFIYQIARGLEYMHSGGIIHRDVKPENILVNAADCKVKITDFEESRSVHLNVDTSPKLTEYVVTRWYRAPEVMCCSRMYDYQVDTWALGCISAELYHRRPVFKGRNHQEQLQLIFHYLGVPNDLSWITIADAKKWIAGMPKKRGQTLTKLMMGADKAAVDFVSNLLTVNPFERPTISQAIAHEWMKEFARDKDYRKCPKVDIGFEYEPAMKTNFGVRHRMYQEMTQFHELCQKREDAKQQKQQK